MRGLPYNATMSDISAFFGGFDILPNGIHIITGRDGRATGEAYVELSSDAQAEQTLRTKHREKIGSRCVSLYLLLAFSYGKYCRYIELFRSSKTELNHILNPFGYGMMFVRFCDPSTYFSSSSRRPRSQP